MANLAFQPGVIEFFDSITQEARIEEGDMVIVVGDPERLAAFREKNREI
jgi:hypothetical protein